jgi:hypothetical protein
MSSATKHQRRPYSRLTVTLPTFIIITLREMVKDENEKHPDNTPWTISLLLERWLMKAFGKERVKLWNDIAEKSPEFKRAAEAWLRSEVPKMFDGRRKGKRK